MTDCIFCKVIARELPSKPVYEDSDVIVIPDIYPQAPVHLLVIPKMHIGELTDATDEILGKLIETMKQIIKKQHIASYRLVVNGKGAAIIDHLHMHILGSVDKKRKL